MAVMSKTRENAAAMRRTSKTEMLIVAGTAAIWLASQSTCYAADIKTGFTTVMSIIEGGAFIVGTVMIIMGMTNHGESPNWNFVMKGGMVAGAGAIMWALFTVFGANTNYAPSGFN